MAPTMIEVRDLTRRFGSITALSEVSFSVPRGQVVGLLGENGAGKTTAMRVLTGFVAPSEGTALVDGLDVVEEPLATRKRIGYLPEGNPLYLDLRLGEILRFSAELHGLTGAARDRAVARSVEMAGLAGQERQVVGTLSKGYRQRAGLAQALLHEPDVLILDEPTSGLDPNQQEEMRGLIRDLREEHTVLLSTHILPEVEAVCDRVLIIHRGKLVADDSVEAIKRQQRGETTLSLVVRGTPEALRAALAEIPLARPPETSPSGEEGVLEATVGLAGHPDRRVLERLAAALASSGLGLSRLETRATSLEEVFARLTTDQVPPAAERR